MATLWDVVTDNSSLPVDVSNTFWDHLNNQIGGGGSVIVSGIRSINKLDIQRAVNRVSLARNAHRIDQAKQANKLIARQINLDLTHEANRCQ